MRTVLMAVVFMAMALLAAACGTSDSEPATAAIATTAPTTAPTTVNDAAAEATEAPEATASDDLFPDVLDATASQASDGTWTINATLSSPYDSPDRYADSWRVVGPDGSVYGERFLTHDHAGEQPFTRSQSGIVIPEDVAAVIIEGRDQVSGWGGGTFELVLNS